MRALWFLANIVILATIGSSFETFDGVFPSQFEAGCPLDHFTCDDGECILLDQHCDRHDDCSDRSDEKNCELNFCQEPNYFQCGNGNCIDANMVCNDVKDCRDGSDEEPERCHPRHNGPPSPIMDECDNQTQFTCEDHNCIPLEWVCDGDPNCLDDSDERASLCTMKHHCSSEEFQCQDGHCIEGDFKCDGSKDCNDGSDEENCPVRNLPVYAVDADCTLDNEKYLCKDRQLCVDIMELCDDRKACLDGSDEGGLCHQKVECTHANCSITQCFPSPEGQFCICNKGFKHENGVCVDVDECDQFGICDQKCNNFLGGYRCSCDRGYLLQKDGRTCRAEGGKEPLIYFSLGNEIRVRFLKSGMYHSLAVNLSQAIGVEVHNHHVYWTNIYEGEEAIVRAQELGSERTPIVTAGLAEPEDLAVDWITGNIYFTDSSNKFIGVCSDDAKHCTVLHNRDINNPRGIALLPYEGYMYWSDWGVKPVIARSGMDGSDVFDFVSKDIGWPNGITIDHGNQRLYWVDAKLTTIESIRLDGNDRRKVLEHALIHPYSIAVFEDTLYWSDWQTLKIESAYKFTGKNRKTVLKDKNKIFGIKVYHPAMHDLNQINYCFGAPCSDLCLLAPERAVGQGPPASSSRRYTCACPDGKELSPNNHTCIETAKSQIIVIGNRDRLFHYEHKQLGKVHVDELPLDQNTAMIGDIGALQYNSLDGSLIVADSFNRKMSSVDMKTLQTRDIVTSGVGRIEGIAFDNLGANIYWTDSELGKVEVINTLNHHRKTIMNHLQGDIPRGIAVIPSEGIMYVSLTSPTAAHIDKLSMANGDLMYRTHIFEENLRGPFLPLFFDGMTHRMFWADSGMRRIEHTSWNGEERHTYTELSVSPISISSVGTDIFWSSAGFKHVNYADKLAFKGTKTLDLSKLVYSNSKIFLTSVTGIDSQRNHPCAFENGNCSHICLVLSDAMRECACPDGMVLKEDRLQCVVPEACERSEFECEVSSVTGVARHCIPLKKKCDGHRDCPQGEDEDRATCAAKELSKLQCLPGQFACSDGQKCIAEALVCNLVPDCGDHSDETAGCDELSRAEPNSAECEFRCGGGYGMECVSEVQRCDSLPDCTDGSDELECDKHTCDTQTQFRCKSGNCISKDLECNGEVDCKDGSDEHKNCNHVRTCSPQQITCDNGQCIDKELKCNGRNDCDDASDEHSCPQRAVPHIPIFTHAGAASPQAPPRECDTRYEFECERGHCIPSTARCNQTSECSNGQDELNCIGCHRDQFQCKNERCIYHTWVCDKKNDCGDNSDEEVALCQARSSGANDGQSSVAKSSDLRCFGSFRCAGDPNECIHTDKVCNGEKDCSDGSDEGGMCNKGCENAGCSDTCQKTPTGPKCTCPKGFELTGDAKTCADIDECATEEYCSQYCSNTPGAFRCSCKAPEYVLRENGMSCRAKGGEMQFIYSVYNEIRTMTGWHSYLGIIYSDPDYRARVEGLTADVARKHVYWTTATNDSLYRVSLNNRRQIRTAHLQRPGRLAIDWITGNVYVVEASSQITAVNFETRTYARLYKSDPAKDIEALAVDPVMRTMFWSERLAHKIQFSTIYRADTSGSNVVEIVTTNLKQVSDIFIDTFHNQIYWADSVTMKVERASFDGTNRHEVFTSPDVPTDITIFEDYIYVLVQADSATEVKEMEDTGNVWRCGLYGAAFEKCELFRIHPKHFTVPYHFDIMHPGLQLRGHNDCLNSTECQSAGGMCLLRNHKLRPAAVCVCADGTRLRKNNICAQPSAQDNIFADETDNLTSHLRYDVQRGFGSVWWLLLGFVFVVVPVVGILFFVYRGGPSTPISPPQWMPGFCTRRFPFHTIRFNSKFGNIDADDTIPAYSDFQFHPCQLNPGEHQYENPIAAMQAEQNGAITIKTMNEIDIQMGSEKGGWLGGGDGGGSPNDGGDDSDSSTVEMVGAVKGDDSCRTLLL